MGKRIVLATVGSYGDLHPFIAVGVALKAIGFEAVIAASDAYRGKVEAEGLEFHPIAPSRERLVCDTGFSESDLVRGMTRSSTKFILERAIIPYLDDTYADLQAAARGADLIVPSNFSLVARVVAAKLGLPVMSLVLSPCVFFSAQEPAYYLEAPWLPALRRRFGPGAARLVLDLGRLQSRMQTRAITRMRRRLGLPIPAGDELLDGFLRADRVVALYSPLLGPLPPEAPTASVIAGFTFYDSEAGGAPVLDRALQAFLDAGPPPLVFSLGSLGVFAAGRFYEEAAAATASLGRRAVLLVGGETYDQHAGLASAQVFVAPYAPHSLVFPRAAAVIHHGGIGTVGHAMRAGKPQLVCPMFGDQLDNAERLKRLGVARRLDHRRFTAARAAQALNDMLADQAAADKARLIADAVGKEDGAQVAAASAAALLA